jgi:hypothetical protein
MWWQISPVRSGSAGWLWWSGKSDMPREASSSWVGALGPAEEERGRPVRSSNGELVLEIEAEAVASVLADSEACGMNKTQGGGGPFVPMQLEDRRDITDHSTHTWGKGTAWCGAEAEHARAVQTAVMARAAAASHEGYAEHSLSVSRCPG